MDLKPFKQILESDDVLTNKPDYPYQQKKEFTIEDINIDLDRKINKCQNYINAFRDFQNEFLLDEEFEESRFNVIYDIKQMISELENYKIEVNKTLK
jgi:hypothetical protein